MGRPPVTLTLDQVREIETLAAVLSVQQIADYFGIARSTFSSLLERDPDIARHYRRATLLASQIPVDRWHAVIGDQTFADAILDRLVHNAHRLELTGESMRKRAATKVSEEVEAWSAQVGPQHGAVRALRLMGARGPLGCGLPGRARAISRLPPQHPHA